MPVRFARMGAVVSARSYVAGSDDSVGRIPPPPGKSAPAAQTFPSGWSSYPDRLLFVANAQRLSGSTGIEDCNTPVIGDAAESAIIDFDFEVL